MSYKIEIFYRAPADARRELDTADCTSSRGGRLDFRESPPEGASGPVCLTFEFDAHQLAAAAAADCLLRQREHVEGPSSYGD